MTKIMTEEQIKQKAEEYINKMPTLCDAIYESVAKEAYIAGTHSRDEEISKLQENVSAMESYIEAEKDCMQDEIDEMREQLKMNAENIQKLRNPWISVEERLPEEGKLVFVCYGSTTPFLYSSAYMIKKNLWSIEGYGNGEINAWMPIPKLKKGE